MMVLRALARGEVRALREVADEIGITAQAVSEHLKRMQEDGLVTTGDGGPRLTQEGLEHLREGLGALKRYVDAAVRELARIEQTPARAGEDIRDGDAVGLFMEDGELVAYPGRASPSQGRAARSARAGEDLVVDSLEGIVQLEPGRVSFGVVSDADAGGSQATDASRAEASLQTHGLVIAVGPVARRVAERAGVEPVRFGGVVAAVDAAVRGVSSIVLVEAAALGEVESRFAEVAAEAGLRTTPVVVDLTA